MCFGTQGRLTALRDDLTVSLNNETIDLVTEFKYLGIVLDKQLTFDKHVDYICRKIFVKIKMLGKVRQYISQKL